LGRGLRRQETVSACLFYAGKADGLGFPEEGPIHLDIEFVPPNKRAHDLDNCLAAIKAGLDGVADAWGVNDQRFTLTIHKADRVGGMVKITRGAAP
jgi:crossover junction endodeoxyribonuclease RusA